MNSKETISVIIPSFKREKLLERCIEYWISELEGRIYSIIVGNSSPYERLKLLFADRKQVKFLDLPEDFWWTQSVNAAIKQGVADGAKYILVTNDDMDYPKDLVKTFTGKLNIYPDAILTIPQKEVSGNLYYGARISGFFKTFKSLGSISGDISIDVTNGSCLFIPSSVFRVVGAFNEVCLPHYSSDIEFLVRCLKNSVKIILINNAPLNQGFPTDFTSRFSISNILTHKGSPYYWRAFLKLGKTLFNNYPNLFFGQGMLYTFNYFSGLVKFNLKKIKLALSLKS